MTVESEDDDAVAIDVTMKIAGDESNVYVDMTGSDELVLHVGSETYPFTHVGDGHYTALVTANTGRDLDVAVELRRADDDSAPDTRGVLARAPIIQAVEDGLSRSQDGLTIEWDEGEGDLSIEASGDCIDSFGPEEIPDLGRYTFAPGELVSSADSACDVTVVLRRINEGSPDARLDDESSMTLTASRSVTFSSSP